MKEENKITYNYFSLQVLLCFSVLFSCAFYGNTLKDIFKQSILENLNKGTNKQKRFFFFTIKLLKAFTIPRCSVRLQEKEMYRFLDAMGTGWTRRVKNFKCNLAIFRLCEV